MAKAWEALLRRAERNRQRLGEELKLVQGRVTRCVDQCRRVTVLLEQAQAELEEMQDRPHRVSDQALRRDFLLQLQDLDNEAEQDLQKAQEKLKVARRAWISAGAECDKYTALIERAEELRREQLAARTQRETDSAALDLYNRRYSERSDGREKLRTAGDSA